MGTSSDSTLPSQYIIWSFPTGLLLCSAEIWSDWAKDSVSGAHDEQKGLYNGNIDGYKMIHFIGA